MERKNGIDGDMGSKTVSAVKAFQTANGLSATGEYCGNTHAALMNAIKKLEDGGINTSFSIKVKAWSV